MKILLEWENRVRADSTCVYFKRAFERVADVVCVYPEEVPYIRPGVFDLHVRVDYGLDRPFPVDLKPSVYYAIDTHIDADWRLEMARKADFDYVFCAQARGAELPWHTERKYWLPLGCEPETHSVQGMRQKRHDICFIGNTQPGWQARRVTRLDRLFKRFPDFYYGNRPPKEATEKYAESRIVFNSAYSDDINMRVFEVMCSGSCLLTDKQDWKGLLVPGKHFMEYDESTMIEKAEYLLANPGVREQIAREGQREAMEHHTYLHRVREMLRIIEENKEKTKTVA